MVRDCRLRQVLYPQAIGGANIAKAFSGVALYPVIAANTWRRVSQPSETRTLLIASLGRLEHRRIVRMLRPIHRRLGVGPSGARIDALRLVFEGDAILDRADKDA